MFGGVAFQTAHYRCQKTVYQSCNKMHMIRHYYCGIKNYFFLFFKPVQTGKDDLRCIFSIKDRFSIKHGRGQKIMLIFDGCATFAEID